MRAYNIGTLIIFSSGLGVFKPLTLKMSSALKIHAFESQMAPTGCQNGQGARETVAWWQARVGTRSSLSYVSYFD
jgi:hypothetical protein